MSNPAAKMSNPAAFAQNLPKAIIIDKAVIIDDEMDICLLLGMALKKLGISSLRAQTLSDGLEKATNDQPTIIFLDNNLPDGQGIDQIAQFRKNVPLAKLIMITAMGGLRERALALGADGFVEKPLDLRKIEAVLR